MLISVVVPTRNEAGNVKPLLVRLERALAGISAEVVFVDDSTDDTAERIRQLRDQFSMPVSVVVRPAGRRSSGLGGAVVEGFGAARGRWVCVMDADLQHPPELIPRMLKQADSSGVDLVLGSRLARGGSAAGLGAYRSVVSRVLAIATRIVFWRRLHNVSDPLTGFFLVRKRSIDVRRLQPRGFKILLEILIGCPWLTVSETPFKFGRRFAGSSKAGFGEARHLLGQYWRLSNLRFPRFVAVGLSGLLVNSLVMALCTEAAGYHYLVSAAVATQGSTLWNFALTETWVFRDGGRQGVLLERFGMFWLVNVAALMLRGPIIHVLTSDLGWHYLVSNILSLGMLAWLRYVMAGKWIWLKSFPREHLPGP